MASSRAISWKTPWFAMGGSGHNQMSVSSLDYLLSFGVQAVILLVLVSSYPDLMHWFVLPVLAAGTLIGVDAVLWFTGRVQLFYPAGILGVLGVHFFFLAPLLHIIWNTEMPYIV